VAEGAEAAIARCSALGVVWWCQGEGKRSLDGFNSEEMKSNTTRWQNFFFEFLSFLEVFLIQGRDFVILDLFSGIS
jgi:hypothetical protein